jgi:hypothetical protein
LSNAAAAGATFPSALRLASGVLAALAVTILIAGAAAASTSRSGRTSAGPTATGSIGLRLLDAPVSAGNDPRARLYIVDHLAPGAVIHRRIEVANTTASVAHAALYAAAATIVNASFLGAAGHAGNDVSAWTSVRPGTVDVPARGVATAIVTIAVPHDASPGERYGVVWAEVHSAPIAGGGVVEVSRVGIRLYLSVGPGGAPAADFAIASLTAARAANGQPMIVATVHNTGGRALDMSGSLRLSAGPGGLDAGPFPVILGTTLAIGSTEPVTIALDAQLPAGPWTARITLRSGLIQHSAQATISFPAVGSGPAVRTTTAGTPWIHRVIAGLALLLMLLGITALLVAHSRRRRRPPPRHRRLASSPSADLVSTNA